MTSIELTVTGPVASARVSGVLTAGMVGVPVTIICDSAWDGLIKTLVCQSSAGKRLVLDVKKDAIVAPEVLQLCKFGTNVLYIGLEGRKPDGTLVITSTLARVGAILPGAIAEGDPTVIPENPAWVNVVTSLRALSNQLAELEAAMEEASGLPEGGAAGQVLAKKSGLDRDTQWVDPPVNGTDGIAPVIGPNGNWYLGDTDTGKPSRGAAGPAGATGADGYTPVRGADYWTEEDKAEIRDEDIAYLSQELAKRQQLTPEYANDISGCTDTSKLYVLPDGYIYAYILGEGTGTKTETVTPVWQLGVKLDKSTGAEGSGGNYTACEPIYIGDGETYVFSVANNYYLSGVACWYGSVGNYLGNTEMISGAASPGAAASATLKPIAGAAYFRLRLYHIWNASSDSGLIQAQLNKATMSKTVPEASEAYGWHSTGHAFVPADYEDRIVSLENAVKSLKGDMSIFGIVDAAKQITLTGALETGTYTIQYQNADGSTVDIGSFQIGG